MVLSLSSRPLRIFEQLCSRTPRLELEIPDWQTAKSHVRHYKTGFQLVPWEVFLLIRNTENFASPHAFPSNFLRNAEYSSVRLPKFFFFVLHVCSLIVPRLLKFPKILTTLNGRRIIELTLMWPGSFHLAYLAAWSFCNVFSRTVNIF